MESEQRFAQRLPDATGTRAVAAGFGVENDQSVDEIGCHGVAWFDLPSHNSDAWGRHKVAAPQRSHSVTLAAA